jgi:hypothetical protein
MKRCWNFLAGLRFGLASIRHAADKTHLRQFNPFWNQIAGLIPGFHQLLWGSRSATTVKWQNNQQMPYSRLGELTRCCAPHFQGATVTLPLTAWYEAVTEMFLFCPLAVTIIRESALCAEV